MSNMCYFSSSSEFQKFCKSQVVKRLGFGSEGSVYLTKSHKALKILSNLSEGYDVESIITADLVDSKNFLFPEELCIVNDKMCGYLTRVVEKDYFYHLLEPQQYMKLNLKSLEKAILRFQIEFERLSNLGIFMYDLPGNVMYDGKEIYAIDTCMYSFQPNAKEKNKGTFEYTIETIFAPLLENILDDVNLEKDVKFDDIEFYLNQIYMFCIGKISRYELEESKKDRDCKYREEYQKMKCKIIRGDY